MLLWANAYAARNRVLNEIPYSKATLRASDLPISTFLHNMADSEMLRERMTVLVSRILVTHLAHFKACYKDTVVWHIPHEYSMESAQKSELVVILFYI
jgi:hypothetical protein